METRTIVPTGHSDNSKYNMLCQDPRWSLQGDSVSSEGIIVEKVNPEPEFLTKEDIAVALAQDMSGEVSLGNTMRRKYGDYLYLSIRDMVYKIANKYHISYSESSDDLVQDCFARIICKLGKFNPQKSHFTTWSYTVCRNFLNKRFVRTQKRRDTMVDAGFLVNDDGESILDNMVSTTINGMTEDVFSDIQIGEIVDATRELARRHPDYQELIYSMLGDPDNDRTLIPRRIFITHSAKEVGMSTNRAGLFLKKVIRPFFMERFKV